MKWIKQIIILSIFLGAGITYFTYFSPNINARIIIITLVNLVIFVELLYVILYKRNNQVMVESILLSVFFVFAIIVFIVRLIITINESSMVSFMDAGFIHSLTIIVFQVLPFSLSITTFWISNSEMERKLKTISMIDALTGLYNRASIMRIIDQSVETYKRSAGHFAIVMADIDFFKKVNDTYGHQAGDTVIMRVANSLSEEIRKGDFVGRYGGEEFIMILFDISASELEQRLNGLREQIADLEIDVNSEKIRITTSFGGVINDACYNSELLIKAADKALYEAKDSGRNRVIIAGKVEV
ncbi:GGDEF domain-containing protein [Eubacteriaceae bacterium ES2]|nr:GGDEF domain-containing protein [Eubacteriaceae bacterium ES2]